MKLLVIPEAAEILQVSNSRAYALARAGVIPVVRVGRQLRVDADRLNEWIANGGMALPGGWKRTPDTSVEALRRDGDQ